LTGDAGGNEILGWGGNDTIIGGDGPDWLAGGSGADVIVGGDQYDHDYANDTAEYEHSNAAVTVSLATGVGSGGDAEGDSLRNIENLYGSAFDDHLTGNADGNWIAGREGNDTIDGGNRDDILDGGAGDDVIDGGDGNQDMVGFTGAQADYTITRVGSTYTVVDNRIESPDGTDTIINVESFNFYGDVLTAADLVPEAGALSFVNNNGKFSLSLTGEGKGTVDYQISADLEKHGDRPEQLDKRQLPVPRRCHRRARQ
jgi:Ca2+-binding RTX toxin-like protein